MKIKDIMTKNMITCNFDSSIVEVAKKMKKYDIGFIPIVKDKKIVGTITDRDIVINNIYNNDNKITIYSENIISIDQNDSLENALEIMRKNKIKRLLVTNKQIITGIISLCDIVNKVNNDIFVNTFSTIYSIDRNKEDLFLEVDEFYL